jgi:recombination protein RecT
MGTPTTAVMKQPSTLGSLNELLTKYKANIAMALPKHMTPERMIRVALTAVSRSPKLQLCDPLTICGAIVQSSILGLEPDPVLGEAFLVPYKNNKRKDKDGKAGVYECQLQVGYKGHVKLARNSGEIEDVYAELVCENDQFDYGIGPGATLTHKPPKTGERGKCIGAWAGYLLKGGQFKYTYMTREEIEAHRDRYTKSKDADGVYGPWVDSPEWMFKKTPLIQVLKLAPKSVSQAAAITLTEQHEAGARQQFTVDVPLELNPPEVEEEKEVKEPQRKSKPKEAEKPPAPPADIPEVTTLPEAFEMPPGTRVSFQGGIWEPSEDRTGWRVVDAAVRK